MSFYLFQLSTWFLWEEMYLGIIVHSESLRVNKKRCDYSNECAYKHRDPFVSLPLPINMLVSAEYCGPLSEFDFLSAVLVLEGREPSL